MTKMITTMCGILITKTWSGNQANPGYVCMSACTGVLSDVFLYAYTFNFRPAVSATLMYVDLLRMSSSLFCSLFCPPPIPHPISSNDLPIDSCHTSHHSAQHRTTPHHTSLYHTSPHHTLSHLTTPFYPQPTNYEPEGPLGRLLRAVNESDYPPGKQQTTRTIPRDFSTKYRITCFV